MRDKKGMKGVSEKIRGREQVSEKEEKGRERKRTK